MVREKCRASAIEILREISMNSGDSHPVHALEQTRHMHRRFRKVKVSM